MRSGMSGNASSVSYKTTFKNNLTAKISFYLGQSVLRNSLKSLLNINCLLCTGLKVWNVIFRVTPLLGSLGGDGSVVQVDLVSEHHEGEIVRITGTSLVR